MASDWTEQSSLKKIWQVNWILRTRNLIRALGYSILGQLLRLMKRGHKVIFFNSFFHFYFDISICGLCHVLLQQKWMLTPEKLRILICNCIALPLYRLFSKAVIQLQSDNNRKPRPKQAFKFHNSFYNKLTQLSPSITRAVTIMKTSILAIFSTERTARTKSMR